MDHAKHHRQVSVATRQFELHVEILKEQWDLEEEEEICQHKQEQMNRKLQLELEAAEREISSKRDAAALQRRESEEVLVQKWQHIKFKAE